MMKKWQFTTLAILLHLALGLTVYATVNKPENTLPPEDVLLASIDYDNAHFAVYQSVGEAIIDGKPYSVSGTAYQMDVVTGILCGPTGEFIQVSADGSTEYSIGDKSVVFVQ